MTIDLNSDESVLVESREMAAEAARNGAIPAVASRISGMNERFEVMWNLTDDPDIVPETGEAVIGAAQALARLTDGIVLVGGSRVVDSAARLDLTEITDLLFPK